MPAVISQTQVLGVTARLSQAWEFLSGQKREFELTEYGTEALAYAEFSFFMSLAKEQSSSMGGVGVLIQAEDGFLVARHMFGMQQDEVTANDVRDACAEVCNLFADCVAKEFGPNLTASFSLPCRASAEEFAMIPKNSRARSVYRGRAGNHILAIVLYDILMNVSLDKEQEK
jgi:hypothetical protein